MNASANRIHWKIVSRDQRAQITKMNLLKIKNNMMRMGEPHQELPSILEYATVFKDVLQLEEQYSN